jgi:hypothetical protein
LNDYNARRWGRPAQDRNTYRPPATLQELGRFLAAHYSRNKPKRAA